MKKTFKLDVPLIFFLLFFIVSIILSFKLKLQEDKYAENEREKHMLEREKQMLMYRFDIINQAFKNTYKITGEKLNISKSEFLPDIFSEKQDIPILYLKEDACSGCYDSIIEKIIKKLGNIEQLRIVSDKSNNDFIIKMSRLNILSNFVINSIAFDS